MLTDPFNLQGDLWIAEKGSGKYDKDGISRAGKWLRILATQGGIVNAWMGLCEEESAVRWMTYLYPGSMPLQLTNGILRDVLEAGEAFTFMDRKELISGGLFPLTVDGHVLGVLAILSDQTDYFKPDTKKWLNTLTGIISHSLLIENGMGRDRDVEYSLLNVLQSSLDVSEGLPFVLKTMTEVLGADGSIALQYNPVPGRFELLITHGLEATALAKLNFHLDAGLMGRSMERRMLWIEDLCDLSENIQPISPLQEAGYRGYLALPLLKENRLLGALEFAWRPPTHTIPCDIRFLERVAEQIAFVMDRTNVLNNYRQINSELTVRYNAMIEGLSRALELRDLETEGHTRRVSRLMMRLVEHAGIGADQWDAIRQGALLHDIGKLGIPDAILLKPGSLSLPERQVMEQHVVFGYNILAPIINLRPVLDIALYHHEHWDGSGYPYKLKGEQIPFVARLFAVVDVFDALTSDRPYRTAWPPDHAREFLREQAGGWFDPQVVKLFLELEEGGFRLDNPAA